MAHSSPSLGITARELSSSLLDGKNVSLDKVLQTFSNVQYYDADPPLVLILTYLWMEYFPLLLEKAEYDENGQQIIEVGAHRKGMLEELEKAHLYIAQLNEKNENLQAEIENLKKEIAEIKKLVKQ